MVPLLWSPGRGILFPPRPPKLHPHKSSCWCLRSLRLLLVLPPSFPTGKCVISPSTGEEGALRTTVEPSSRPKLSSPPRGRAEGVLGPPIPEKPSVPAKRFKEQGGSSPGLCSQVPINPLSWLCPTPTREPKVSSPRSCESTDWHRAALVQRGGMGGGVAGAALRFAQGCTGKGSGCPLPFPPPSPSTCCFAPRLCSLPLALGFGRLERAGRSSGLTFCGQHVRKVNEGCFHTPKPTLGLY